MPLHLDQNGVGAVTPNYLFSANGVVAHPLQRAGVLPHFPSANGGSPDLNQVGHPWHDNRNSATIIGRLFG